MEVGFLQNEAGHNTLHHPGYRNVYYEELKYNAALLEEFKSYLRSQKVSGKFALINGYLEFHWGSGKANLYQDCNFKANNKKTNYQLVVPTCFEYGNV